MKLPISIIIPTFNEERFLPDLLKSIKSQTVSPQEILIVDAFSIDQTREVAKTFGCKIIKGGLPAKARNNGAKLASEKILLFLDADVVLPPAFLERTITEMHERKLDIASCFVTPRSSLKVDRFLHQFANQYMRFTQKFYPHIPGFCIFVKRDIHQKVNGFDETLVLSEDQDYVRRVKKVGKFGYLKSYKIPVSVRRFAEDGRLKVALKYIAIELHLIFLGKIKSNIFNYKFGNHS